MSTHAHGPETLADEVHRRSGVNPAACYQCGKCSAGCPMAAETRLRPHDVMRLVNQGKRDRLLKDESIWLCLGCETCTTRCPNGCDPARVTDALREMAVDANPKVAPKAIRAFHRTFLDQIKAHGRLFEFGLVVRYKMRGGPLFQDATAAPSMMSRGLLGFSPDNIEGRDEVRAIFEACLESDHAHGHEHAHGEEGDR